MKTKALILNIAMSLVGMTSEIHAQTTAPSVSPDDIRDGVVNVIDPRQISDLIAWGRSSKTDLEDALKKIREMRRSERRKYLKETIIGVIGSSGESTAELLMRSVLRRARNIDEILSTAPSSPEGETFALRFLEDSVRWAVNLYQTDEEFLIKASGATNAVSIDLDFTGLGVSHGQYIVSQLWMSPSLTARLTLLKESFSYFYNDLNRDNIGRRHSTIANVLMKLANFAEKMNLNISTQDYIKSIEGFSDSEKLKIGRKIEAFYKEQLDKVAGVQLNRNSTTVGGPSLNGSFAYDSLLKAKFAYIKPGKFVRATDESAKILGDKPHTVTLTRGFAMQVSAVTQAQWFSIMGKNPSRFTGKLICPKDHKVIDNYVYMCPNHPVENVSWEDTQEFIEKLNKKVGSNIYRLPTEAEWEYAARAGTSTEYFFGDDKSQLGDYAWYSENSETISEKTIEKNSLLYYPGRLRQTHPVCTKKPNPWGLCDMYGNVSQWVQDLWEGYPKGDVIDPVVNQSKYNDHFTRGGNYKDDARYTTSSQRSGKSDSQRNDHTGEGLRLVKTINSDE